MASSPFSYGMPNFTSQFSTSILAYSSNTRIGLGGTTPPHTPFLFGCTHVPQMTHTFGGFPPFNPVSNPIPNDSGWSNQLGGQAKTYGPSFTLTSSILILTNTFGMENPSLSSKFTPKGGQFHTLGNPQPRANLAGGSFYNPHQKIPTGMVPNQPLMNHSGGGSYNPEQGHGAYKNPGWVVIVGPFVFG
jgi:hypothetical protein